jgi:hypothetical protein
LTGCIGTKYSNEEKSILSTPKTTAEQSVDLTEIEFQVFENDLTEFEALLSDLDSVDIEIQEVNTEAFA